MEKTQVKACGNNARDVFIDIGNQLVRLSNIRCISTETNKVFCYDGDSFTCKRDIAEIEKECFVYMMSGIGTPQTIRPLLTHLAAQWLRLAKTNIEQAEREEDPQEKACFNTRATCLFGRATELQQLEETLASVCTGSPVEARAQEQTQEPSATERPA